jgi:hypothetical protein
LTGFIIESQKMLQEDSGKLGASAMIFYINSQANGTFKHFPEQPFQPTSWSIHVNCLFFASLSASLLAALASVLCLQWVFDYDMATSRTGSSAQSRMKFRQFRYDGVVYWKMETIIAVLPLLIYVSVILFFIGVTIWMHYIRPAVSHIVLGVTVVAASFYLFTTCLSLASASAPFRTPVATGMYFLFHKTGMYFLLHKTGMYFLLHKISQGFRWLFSVGVSLVHKISARRKPSDPTPSSDGTTAPPRNRPRTPRPASYPLSAPDIRTRENLRIEVDPNLAPRAYAWLSTNTDLSLDQYDTLLLIVEELPLFTPQQLKSTTLSKVPWEGIFNLLTARYLHPEPMDNYSKGDMEAITTILWGLNTFLSHESGSADFGGIRSKLLQLGFHALNVSKLSDKGQVLNVLLFLLNTTSWNPGDTSVIFSNSKRHLILPQESWVFRLRTESWMETVSMSNIHHIFDSLLKLQRSCPDLRMSRVDDEDKFKRTKNRLSGEDHTDILQTMEDQRVKWHLEEILVAFDSIMFENCDPEHHLVMAELLCMEMERDTDYFHQVYLSGQREARPLEMHDLSLRLIACLLGSMEWENEWSNEIDAYNHQDSWSMVSMYCCSRELDPYIPVWRLRNQSWSKLNLERTAELLSRALLGTDTVVKTETLVSTRSFLIDSSDRFKSMICSADSETDHFNLGLG